MLDFITRFFKREEASKTLAKERLRLVLMSDRVSLAPDVFDEMKGEMLSVIRRYLEIDEHALDMHFENLERQFALLASIPVLKVRSAEEIRALPSLSAPSPAASPAFANGNATAVIEGPRPTPSRRRRRRRRSSNGTISSNGVGHAEQEAPADEPPAGPDTAG